MRSAMELEVIVKSSHGRLLAEAAAERLAREARPPLRQRRTVRVRMASLLYALADRLSAETPARVKRLKTA